jgi:hypothetical protein
MACCEGPLGAQVTLCTNDSRNQFGVSIFQEFDAEAETQTALISPNSDQSLVKAGTEAYMCQLGYASQAEFQADFNEAWTWFQRQFALPNTAFITPIDGIGATLVEQQAITALGLPLWDVNAPINGVTTIIGFYRPTVNCKGLEVVCYEGLEKHYTKAAMAVHELYFSANLPTSSLSVQDQPTPPIFPPNQVRGNPQQYEGNYFTIRTFVYPLQVYGRIFLYTECGQRSEIKVRSQFAVLPAHNDSITSLTPVNPDGVTIPVEYAEFGGVTLQAASRQLSNSQWIGTVSWAENATISYQQNVASGLPVTPYHLHQSTMLTITFPASLLKCAKIFPCPCPNTNSNSNCSKNSSSDNNTGCSSCNERRS